MSHAEVQATMKSVAELIATMQDPKAQHVCWVIAGMLERCLNENVELRARVAFLEAENAALRAENAELRAENAYLKEQVAYLKRQIFGKKSEFKPKDRPPPDAPPVDNAKVAAARELQKKARALMIEANAVAAKKTPNESKLNQQIIRRRVPEGIICTCCQGAVKDLGMAHTAVELDTIPISYIQRTYLLHRGGCGCGAVNFVMPGPDRGLEQTTASPSMIAECAVDKFLYHFPVHRQEAYFKQHGLNLSRSTVNAWILRGALVVEPLWRALRDANKLQPVKLCDETPICVVKGDESKDRFLWCVVTMLAVTFDVTEKRNRNIAADILGDVGDATMTDGLGCYSKASVPGIHANCFAHARRKFYDSLLSFPGESMAVLSVIHDLFMIERMATESGLDADGRLALRKAKSVVLLNELHTLVDSMNPPPRSSLGKAIKYLKKRWVHLTRFLADGRIPLSNNEVETRFRDVKLGFKNFLFAQSELGAEAVAIYYSLIATARLYGHDPNDYLADVMTKITAGFPHKRIEELLPWNWQPPKTLQQHLPPMTCEEQIPIERILDIKRLSGKIRRAGESSGPDPGVQKTAVH